MRMHLMIGAAALLLGCKPGDVLNVPPPATQLGTGTPQNAADAELAYAGAVTTLFQALDAPFNLLEQSGLFTDEFRSAFATNTVTDARYTSGLEVHGQQVNGERDGDAVLVRLYDARSSLLLAEKYLRRYEAGGGQYKAGEAFALVGYIELFMAEDYCAGVTLSYVPDGGGIIYGQPLTTDSLLGVAEAHFDSALAHAHGNAGVQGLASVGLGRARLDRAHYAEAATAVGAVPTSFVYSAELAHDASGNGPANMYTSWLGFGQGQFCADVNVADHQGTNGLGFVSAGDARLVLDSTVAKNCRAQEGLPDSLLYYPTKFGYPPTGHIPLATGVEARLIEAEAALAAHDAAAWATDLNALRAAAPATYLALGRPMDPLKTDSTSGASAAMQVDVMFRERAFWLYGTGTRLGDLRRLIRNYHRDAGTVYPTGAYLDSDPLNSPDYMFSRYGPDVSFTLPTAKAPSNITITNPNYKGCLTSPATA